MSEFTLSQDLNIDADAAEALGWSKKNIVASLRRRAGHATKLEEKLAVLDRALWAVIAVKYPRLTDARRDSLQHQFVAQARIDLACEAAASAPDSD